MLISFNPFIHRKLLYLLFRIRSQRVQGVVLVE
jgi:hypothetical protein